MTESQVKIRISLKDGEFEIPGPEAFVTDNIADFKKIMSEFSNRKNALQQEEIKGSQITKSISEPADNSTSFSSSGDWMQKCSNIVDVKGSKITFIKVMSGNSKSGKIIQYAKIYLWVKSMLGQEEVSRDEIRDLCKEQGCLDEKNFTAIIKKNKHHIIVSTQGGSVLCRLTGPGKIDAQELISLLNN